MNLKINNSQPPKIPWTPVFPNTLEHVEDIRQKYTQISNFLLKFFPNAKITYKKGASFLIFKSEPFVFTISIPFNPKHDSYQLKIKERFYYSNACITVDPLASDDLKVAIDAFQVKKESKRLCQDLNM